MSYPTEPTSVAEIRQVLEERHPLGYVLHGRHKGEIADVVRVREQDIEVIVSGIRDGVPHDAVALVPDDFDPTKEPAHSTDPVEDAALQADADKLRGLGADPGPTLDELDDHEPPDES